MSERTHSTSATRAKPLITPFPTGVLQRACACGTHTGGGECGACAKKEQTLQREATSDHEPTEVPPLVHEVLRSPGQPLDQRTRGFFEPRFGRVLGRGYVGRVSGDSIRTASPDGPSENQFEREADRVADTVLQGSRTPVSVDGRELPADFSQVRVHTDAEAARAARAVHAEAFTLGSHIVFGEGRFAPSTSRGRHLLAHELTHCAQQAGAPRLQRKLTVDRNPPANAPAGDPASSLSPATRFSMMDTLMQGLCDEFEVDGSSGEVLSKARQSLDPADLASGNKPTGCCCLNVLTEAQTDWTIKVSGIIGAQTDPTSHQVFLNPTNTPLDFGSFTSTGSLAFQGAVPTAGHELCGHAALQEIGAHPPDQDRLTTDVHDPTVRIENLISTEQGVPASQLRGLAASGPHRGESVDKITIGNFPFNGTAVPASENDKIRLAAAYIHTAGQNEFVSVLGHSDAVGSPAGKQEVSDSRARAVKRALDAEGVPQTITKFGQTTARYSRVEGVSDSQPPPPPLNADPANWRRAEILMSSFPAGAQVPPPGTPTTVNPHTRNTGLPAVKASADPCVSKLVLGAYP